jgi:uncharacterized membrane protein YccC
VGAVWIVALSAWFPQDRVGFLMGLALWGGACALVATLLRNFASYAAALAGYSAAIIASDTLGATGGTNGQAFSFALTRVSEIWIGIVCAGVVLAGTDFGAAPRRLAALFSGLSATIAARFGATLASPAPLSVTQPVRRELIQQVTALDPVIDEALGESSRIRYHSPLLQGAVDGLFAALAAWRVVAARLASLPAATARHETDAILHTIPQDLCSASQQGEPATWMADPMAQRRLYLAGIRKLIAMPADTPSLRLLADNGAKVLGGLARVLDALALLISDPARRYPGGRRLRLQVPDWWPALVNAGRAFVTIGAVAIFWIVSEWPSGAVAITWTAITVIVLAPRGDEAYARAMGFTVGNGLAAVCAAIMAFAVLPKVETFAGFSLVLGFYLVPVGMLMAQPWQVAIFTPMVANFVPLLSPANQTSYDTVQFYNYALALVAGNGVAVLAFRLLPPLSPAFRTRRLLALTLRDLHQLATDEIRQTPHSWEGRVYSRLAVFPEEAEPLQRAQLVAALSVGTEIIHLRRIAPRFGWSTELDMALEAFAQGNTHAAIARLTDTDHRLAALADTRPQASLTMRTRGRILVICDALVQHAAYFEGASR